MSRAVLANSNRVVSEHENNRKLHQRAQPHRAAHVIDKDEKSRAEGPDLYQTESVQDGSHGMFTDAEVKITSGIVLRREIAGALLRNTGLGRWCEVRGPSDQPGHILGDCVQRLSRGLTRRQAFRVRGEFRKVMVPTFRELAVLHAIQLFG